MREILIIKTENGQQLRNLLDKNNVSYQLYQELSRNNFSHEEKRRRLTEGYKRSAKRNQEIFADFERTALNDLDE